MFDQEPPELSNSYHADELLNAYLDRKTSDDRREAMSEPLAELGALATGSLFELQLETLDEEPELVKVSPWGKRVDRITHTDVWKRGREIAVDYELVSLPYDGESRDPIDRVEQFARVYLYAPSSDTYTCPLAMTDGAARTLADSGNDELVGEALPHLTSSEEDNFWTSGQWMTETTGGSDVSRANTTAEQTADGWELHGRKWFTSAIGSEMALTLAKTDGADSDELTLFYVRAREEDGTPRNFRIERLKDKLGTRELPTGEIVLEGTPAEPVKGIGHGVKNIYPMLNVTRTWNAICSVAAMRRGLDLAESYAEKRKVFDEDLADKPLHSRVMDRLEAETQGAFMLGFRAVELLDSDEEELMRAVVPLAKLYTAKQAVTVTSEVVEVFAGAGYVEDTGIPKMLRDTQVLPIWEGTTNVLSLEVLRQLADEATRQRLREEADRIAEDCGVEEVSDLAATAKDELNGTLDTVEEHFDAPDELEAGARSIAFRLGRVVETLLLAEQADWNRRHDRASGSLTSARTLLGTIGDWKSEYSLAPLSF